MLGRFARSEPEVGGKAGTLPQVNQPSRTPLSSRTQFGQAGAPQTTDPNFRCASTPHAREACSMDGVSCPLLFIVLFFTVRFSPRSVRFFLLPETDGLLLTEFLVQEFQDN